MSNHMKKPFIYIGIGFVVLTLSTGQLWATEQVLKPSPVVETKTASTTDSGVVLGISADAPLAERKVAAETILRDIAEKLTTFTTRTQVALDRLTAKGIDTAGAQVELTTTATALALAKTNLDLFTALKVKEGDDTTPIKDALKTIETNLTDARTHLIAALVALKAAALVTAQ